MLNKIDHKYFLYPLLIVKIEVSSISTQLAKITSILSKSFLALGLLLKQIGAIISENYL